MRKTSVLLQQDTPPKKLKPLTAKQRAIVEAKLEGASDHAAVNVEGANTRNTKALRTAEVQHALAEARAGISEATTLKRLDVIEGVLDAIQMARTLSEPATMIQGYDKLAKIMGYYAPETVKVEITVSQERMRAKMEAMTDEELLQIADGQAAVFEGVFERVAQEATH